MIWNLRNLKASQTMTNRDIARFLKRKEATQAEIDAFLNSQYNDGNRVMYELLTNEISDEVLRTPDLICNSVEDLCFHRHKNSQGVAQALFRVIPTISRHFPRLIHTTLWRHILEATPTSMLSDMCALINALPQHIIRMAGSRGHDLELNTLVVGALKDAVKTWPLIQTDTLYEYGICSHAVEYTSETTNRNAIIRAMYDGSDGLDNPGHVLESFATPSKSSRYVDELKCLAQFGIDFRDLDTDYKWQGVDSEVIRLKARMSVVVEHVSSVMSVPALARLTVGFLCHDKML